VYQWCRTREIINVNLTTPMIITNHKNYDLSFEHIDGDVTNSEKVVTYKLK